MIGYFIAFVITGVIILFKKDFFTLTLPQTLGFLWNGVFTMAIPNALWVLALRNGCTAKISNLAYVTPFLSMLLAYLILHEEIKLQSVLGLVIIVGGILLQLKKEKKKKDRSIDNP